MSALCLRTLVWSWLDSPKYFLERLLLWWSDKGRGYVLHKSTRCPETQLLEMVAPYCVFDISPVQ